jgi:hypothetical protein
VRSVTRYRYDEEASAAWHMDVVHEVPDGRATSVARWVAAQRQLNAIDDPLARKLVALHRDCGSGDGPCDEFDDDERPRAAARGDWGCETTAIIAAHFGISYAPPG